jgi:hypothetical protein
LQISQCCRYDSFTIPRKGLLVVSVALGSLLHVVSAQPLPVDYVIHLASATSYDTRSRDEDTIHAALSVFVNGERRGVAVWDGKGWDGSRAEGRRWVSGLHLFGPSTGSTVQVMTGRLQDTDTLEIVYQIVNASRDLSDDHHGSMTSRIHLSSCAGVDGASAWDCLGEQAAALVAGVALEACDGVVAADKLVYPALQLRRKTETGDTVTVNNLYRGLSAPTACGQSIYAAVVTIARR